jgi:hypothetical protein
VNGIPDVGRLERALHRSRAHEAARHRVDLDPEARRAAESGRKFLRYDGPQLDDRVVSLSLDPACPNDDAALVERQVRRVEEEDLADLSIERVDPEGCPSSSFGHGHGELELDTVGALDEREQLGELLSGEGGFRRRCHRGSFLLRPARNGSYTDSPSPDVIRVGHPLSPAPRCGIARRR